MSLLKSKTSPKPPERVERISNKKYGNCPVDDFHIFYGAGQGCPLAGKFIFQRK